MKRFCDSVNEDCLLCCHRKVCKFFWDAEEPIIARVCKFYWRRSYDEVGEG